MNDPTTPTAGGDQTADTAQQIAEQVRALMARLRAATAASPFHEGAPDDGADDGGPGAVLNPAIRDLTRTLRDAAGDLAAVLTNLANAYDELGSDGRGALRLTDAGGAIKTACTDLARAIDAM